jgi:uncharacterized protein
MSKREEFNTYLKQAMRDKDQVAVSTIRLILAALKDRDIAARTQGKAEGIGEAEIFSMMQGMVKQRKESAKIYSDAGRTDLAEREDAEIVVIEKFLPQQIGQGEVVKIIEKIIAETGAAGIKDMGKVMGVLKGQYAGQVDMAKAGAVVKEKLG